MIPSEVAVEVALDTATSYLLAYYSCDRIATALYCYIAGTVAHLDSKQGRCQGCMIHETQIREKTNYMKI